MTVAELIESLRAQSPVAIVRVMLFIERDGDEYNDPRAVESVGVDERGDVLLGLE